MILGMPPLAFTLLHVAISLIAIAAGVMVLAAMLRNKRAHALTALFLITTLATSVTGFLFPFKGFTPGVIVGAISVVALAAAMIALYVRRLIGVARPVYVVGAVFALYLNVFVAIAQAFQKIFFLKALAPTGAEPPFLLTQLAVLAIFIILGLVALLRFHPPIKATAKIESL